MPESVFHDLGIHPDVKRMLDVDAVRNDLLTILDKVATPGILRAACGGSLTQKCGGCGKIGTVTILFLSELAVHIFIKPEVVSVPGSHLTFHSLLLDRPRFTCQPCSRNDPVYTFPQHESDLDCKMAVTLMRYTDSYCFNCGLCGDSVHMCTRCESKANCSRDWKVHAKYCPTLSGQDPARHHKDTRSVRTGQARSELMEASVSIVADTGLNLLEALEKLELKRKPVFVLPFETSLSENTTF